MQAHRQSAPGLLATIPEVPPDPPNGSRETDTPEEATETVVATAVSSESIPGDEVPSWPDAASENAFLSQQKEDEPGSAKADSLPAKSPVPQEPEPALPALPELVNRLRPETRDLLEALFRVRFVSVDRIPKQSLKA